MMQMTAEPRAPATIPTSTGMPFTIPCIDWPARTMFDEKKPRYMTAAITTMMSAPNVPNWPRLWIIWGIPI